MNKKEKIYGLVEKTVKELDKEVKGVTIFVVAGIFFTIGFLKSMKFIYDLIQISSNPLLNSISLTLIIMLIILFGVFTIHTLVLMFVSKYKKVEIK